MVVIHQLRPIGVSRPRAGTPASVVGWPREAWPLKPCGGEEAQPEKGRLTFIDNAVDTATGTIRLKGSFANDAARLWPGQFVTVVLTLGRLEDVVTVPQAAVQAGQQGAFVFVLKADGSVEQRP
jgi:multidrug efflux pump subunit AcrA (membrane-fusion protein)